MSVGEGPIGENIYIVRPRHFFGGVGGAVGENAAMPRSVYVTAWRAAPIDQVNQRQSGLPPTRSKKIIKAGQGVSCRALHHVSLW